jgi:pimeloyl-ACP methyl ester carboxylesterase
MKLARFTYVGIILIAGCGRMGNSGSAVNDSGTAGSNGPDKSQSLAEARKDFTTKNIRATEPAGPLPEPPAKLFLKTKFEAPVGKLSTYLTPDPKDGKKRPAIIWITGGDCNSIDDSIWQPAPPSNDQTASAFREARIVMMFPSLRGGNDNPGRREGFFGEVKDVLAAADFLAKQNHVDPQRIYLGGHSTGGTLVLLTGEYSDRFRAVFSFGPADDVSGYPPEFAPFDQSNRREVELRSPIHWLNSIKAPVFVFEGTQGGNTAALDAMKRATTNAKVQFYKVAGASHFSILAPTTRLIAEKILADNGDSCNITFTNEELDKLFRK